MAGCLATDRKKMIFEVFYFRTLYIATDRKKEDSRPSLGTNEIVYMLFFILLVIFLIENGIMIGCVAYDRTIKFWQYSAPKENNRLEREGGF